jgi:hypothetical protein
MRKTRNQLLLRLAVVGGIFPPKLSALESKWATLFDLSRSVTSNEPVLFRRPARYTRAYSRRKKGLAGEQRARRNERTPNGEKPSPT